MCAISVCYYREKMTFEVATNFTRHVGLLYLAFAQIIEKIIAMPAYDDVQHRPDRGDQYSEATEFPARGHPNGESSNPQTGHR